MERFSLQCHCYGCLRFVNCHPTKLPRHHSHKKRSIIGERERAMGPLLRLRVLQTEGKCVRGIETVD